MRHKRTQFAFKDNTIWFQCFYSVPYILRNIHTIDAVFLTENQLVDYRAIVVMSGHSHFASEYNKCLILLKVSMNRDFGTGFYGIEHTMAQFIQRMMKIIVHPQPRCFLGCG